ncbi:MAG TPA: folate family ECF transporter S component [Clostridiales bacterium]|mgnify:CR=1 FL=1|nr:folate family ECF transporter S component [Clostridiales bacterium]HOL91860.1 folate family ECF transporter S component [Clostridiales bacterium]HPP35485.1 folate family ECF transporter S component [Clostridiales bacterium]
MKKTKVIVFMSILTALNVLLTHVVPLITTDFVRISFGFIPLSLGAMLFGPVIGGIGGAVSDLLGMVIAPKGPYFPGFTLSAFLSGVIYGLFLYRKPKNLGRITLAVLCVSIFVNLGLNTLWLTMLQGKGFLALLPARALQNAVTSVVQIVLIPLVWKYAGRSIENEYLHQPV